MMWLSETEVNSMRLLAAAPQQQNQAKLIHYVATLREQLEQLAEERTPEGLPRVSNAKVNDYSGKVEVIVSKFFVLTSNVEVSKEVLAGTSVGESPSKAGESTNSPSSGLRKRFVVPKLEYRVCDTVDADQPKPVKLDAVAQAHIEKHRKLQEDLTDEMVGLAHQLKESSLMMSRSIQNTKKILDSTEKAIQHSLASTGHANSRSMEVYSESFKTMCFMWLVIFVMTCIFIMLVLLIRVT